MLERIRAAHFQSIPVITFPDGGETLSGVITLQWTAVIDSYSHSVTYSVYYSSNAGATWILLETGITSTSYNWDTTTIPDGLSYLIKVVATCSRGLTAEDLSGGTFAIQNALSTITSQMSSSVISFPIPGPTGFILLLSIVSIVALRRMWRKIR